MRDQHLHKNIALFSFLIIVHIRIPEEWYAMVVFPDLELEKVLRGIPRKVSRIFSMFLPDILLHGLPNYKSLCD